MSMEKRHSFPCLRSNALPCLTYLAFIFKGKDLAKRKKRGKKKDNHQNASKHARAMAQTPLYEKLKSSCTNELRLNVCYLRLMFSEDSLKLRNADGKTPYRVMGFASPSPNMFTLDGLDSQESDGLVGHAFTRSFFEACW